MDKQTWARMNEGQRKAFAIKRAATLVEQLEGQSGPNTASRKVFFHMMRRFFPSQSAKRFKPYSPRHAEIQGCVNSWVRHYGSSGDSGKLVFVFASSGSKKALRKIRKALHDAGIAVFGVHPGPSAYDCTGAYMSDEVDFHVCKGRVFVTQSWSLDV